MWVFEKEINLGIDIGEGLLPNKTTNWKIVNPESFLDKWRPILQRNGSDCGVMVCLHLLGISFHREFPHILAYHSLLMRKLVLLSLLKKEILI